MVHSLSHAHISCCAGHEMLRQIVNESIVLILDGLMLEVNVVVWLLYDIIADIRLKPVCNTSIIIYLFYEIVLLLMVRMGEEKWKTRCVG